MPNPLSRNPRDRILFGPTIGPAPAGYYLLPTSTFLAWRAAAPYLAAPSTSARHFFNFIDSNADLSFNYYYLGPNRVSPSQRYLDHVSTRWVARWRASLDPRIDPPTLLAPRQHGILFHMRDRVLLYLTA